MTRTRIGATLAASLSAAILLTGVQPAAGERSDPHWSPGPAAHPAPTVAPVVDGRIVYVNLTTGQIETINPDGTARVEVTHEGSNLFPRWMPGSERILFSSDRGGDGFHLFTVAADGSNPVQVTHSPDGYSDDASAVTPDGTRIVFNRCQHFPPGGCALFSVAADGSDLQSVTSFVEGVRDFLPDVSPDGSRLAFHRYDPLKGIFDQVWVAQLDGSHPHPVTDVALEASAARWTPDGRHLLVEDSSAHFGNAVVRIPAEPGPEQRLTDPSFPHSDLLADPSPNGRQIVFVSDRAQPGFGGYDLVVMRPDGSQPHVITSNAFVLWPDWGSAPLLPADASTPAATFSPSPATSERATLQWAMDLTGSPRAEPMRHLWSAGERSVPLVAH